MKTIALLMILNAPGQVARSLSVTIEVKKDVPVTHSSESSYERGTLYLNDKEKAFLIRKGQRFQMVATGQDGSCRIRFEDKEYELASCPWMEGFRDHQADIFSIVDKK